jgi:hypothetical protein
VQHGDPISYMVLAEGTPVLTRDETRIGEVKRVLADFEEDVFDGLIIDTRQGERFVDAPHVRELYERAVLLDLSAEEAAHLPEPTASPAVMHVDPDDTAQPSAARRTGDALRRAWDRISGKY